MPLYKLHRHVIHKPNCMEAEEVWGINRAPPPPLETRGAPRDTDRDDPLRNRNGDCCTQLLWRNGNYVPWHHVIDWLSDAEAAGYEVISGFKNLTPYSVILLRGP